MEQVYLKQLVNNNPQGTVGDVYAPFSFLEWKQRRPAFAEKDVIYHYNQYVLQWFDKNKERPISQKFVLRQKYLYLLDQLQLFFSDEEKNAWYSKVNLADERELLLAIPFFAKKLKDISLYYLKLRNKLKNTKLKYNTVGTLAAVEQEVYRYMLESFSSLNTELSSFLQTTVPQFSSLQQALVVEVEEMYDDQQYFDLSNTLPVSSYFDLFHGATEQYFLTKGIVLSSAEWLFSSLNVPVTSSIDSFLSSLTASIFETADANLYGSFVQSYLAENKYTTEFLLASSTIETTSVPIAVGNNSFFFPGSIVDPSVTIKGQLPVVPLSSLVPDSGTAGASLEDSDTIFVKNGTDIQSAWLHYKEYNETDETVKATLKQNSTTSFIFPYPGYGLSGTNLEWTGPSFESTAGYDFISQKLRASVDTEYWSQTLASDYHEPFLLNNSSLVSNKATPSKNPTFSDQIRIYNERNQDTTIPKGDLSAAWLFKFERTAIPISPNSTNVILWPYTPVDVESDYEFHNISFTGACRPTPIHLLDTSFCVAASSFELSDKIYKLNNFEDDINKALECAWLSAGNDVYDYYQKPKQDGFSVLFAAGEFTKFLWDGPEVSIDEVFSSIEHSKDCPFVTDQPSVSSLEWQKCSCKQVYYSPFGHPGKQFQDNNSFADCIFEDTAGGLEAIDLGSWRDSEGKNYSNSKEFVWYQTKSDHAWGNGSWVTNQLSSVSFEPFKLKSGKVYVFYRAGSRASETNLPPYSVNYSYRTNNTKWVEAKIQPDGTWNSTGRDSQLSAYPGDFLKYERNSTSTFYLISSVDIENLSENSNGTVWSALDTVAVGSGAYTTGLFWPIDNYVPIDGTNSPLSSQYISTSLVDLTAINAWEITRDEDGESQTILNQFAVTFAPPTTGTYSIAVTATKAGGQKVYADSAGTHGVTIPKISAIPQFSKENIYFDIQVPTNGFLIEQNLYGWNYNTNSSQSTSLGARPYWAKLITSKDPSTRFKGIYSWGYPNDYIDNYLPNHNPIISPLEIAYGSVIDYDRRGYDIQWSQPIAFKTFVGETQWCQMSASVTDFSNLSALYRTKREQSLSVFTNTSASDITLTNIKNGLPVEIYYHALSSFTWQISVEVAQTVEPPQSEEFFVASAPWANLSNRFYPSVATVPVLENTYTAEDVGGYFTPKYLGASQLINKDFDSNLKTQFLSGLLLTEDETVHIGGRGRTKQDQETIYTWEENNQWMKESPVSNQLAGSVKKSLTKTLQTFVPYQTNDPEVAVGLVTPTSRISPWGGSMADEWTDVANEPKSFTGVRNVSAWASTQVLKQNKKTVDVWTTDIFGNQYGLFKETDGVPVSQRSSVLGELWVRQNNQFVNPAYKSLSVVFQLFETSQDSTFYNQLTGQGIKSVDCFFNTLLIETPLSAIYVQLDYDYDSGNIFTVYDDIVKETNNNNHRFEQTWFFPEEKKIITLFTNLTAKSFYPELTELNLDTKTYKTIFPASSSLDAKQIISPLSGIGFIEIGELKKGCLNYNKTQQTYLITYNGKESSQSPFVVDFEVEQRDQAVLKEINVFLDNVSAEPPVVLSQYLQVFNVPINTTSVVSVSATNNPTNYSVLNYQTNVTVTSAGNFNLYFDVPGLYHVNYQVSNNAGTNNFCLTLSAS